VKWSSFIAMVVGFWTAYLFYIRSRWLPSYLANQQSGLYNFLLNKWYFDELYDVIFTKNVFRIGKWFWKGGDTYIIDGFGPDGLSSLVARAAKRLGAVQSGYLYHYAFAMIVGIALLVTWFVVGGAG